MASFGHEDFIARGNLVNSMGKAFKKQEACEGIIAKWNLMLRTMKFLTEILS